MKRRPSPACPRNGGRGRSWPATPTSTTPITPGKRRPGSPGGRRGLLRIIDRIQQVGARRIGLEVALSTTGDELSLAFLQACAPAFDLISLPLDGASEEVSSRTKKPGHFTAILQALERLREFPTIDVKLCTPVTRHNLEDVPNIARLAEEYAETTQARVFYNIFQTFRRTNGSPEGLEDVVED